MTTSHGGVAAAAAGGALTGSSAANALDATVAVATNSNEASFFIDIAPIPVLHTAPDTGTAPKCRSASAADRAAFSMSVFYQPRLILQQMLPFYAVWG